MHSAFLKRFSAISVLLPALTQRHHFTDNEQRGRFQLCPLNGIWQQAQLREDTPLLIRGATLHLTTKNRTSHLSEYPYCNGRCL